MLIFIVINVLLSIDSIFVELFLLVKYHLVLASSVISITDTSARPVQKCADVRKFRSSISSLGAQSSLQIRHASNCAIMVEYSTIFLY